MLDRDTLAVMVDTAGFVASAGSRGGLTVSDVHAAADALYESYGRAPTQTEMRASLGRGSFSTIGTAMKAWRPGAGTHTAPEPALPFAPLPEAVKAALGGVAETVWRVARAESRSELESERSAMEGRVAEAEQSAKAMAETADEIQAHSDRLTHELQALAAKLGEALDRVRQLDADGQQVREQLALVQGQTGELRTERDALQGRLSAAIGERESLRTALAGALEVRDREANARVSAERTASEAAAQLAAVTARTGAEATAAAQRIVDIERAAEARIADAVRAAAEARADARGARGAQA
jgi:hypothetical protein